jgi:hypothetical protein
VNLLAFTLLMIVAVAACYACGYTHGKSDGMRKGRESEENWWLGAEKEVEKTREKIWREE